MLLLSSLVLTHVLGAQKNRISRFEYIQHIFGLRNMKNNFLLCTLICGTDELPPLTCLSHVLFISLGSLGD